MTDADLPLHPLRPYQAGELQRLGREGDGGYVVPVAAVQASGVLLGIGIHDDWSFEEDFKRHQPAVRVVAVDGTAGMSLLLWRAFPRIFQILGAALLLDFERVKMKAAYFKKITSFRRFFGHEVFLRKMLRPEGQAEGNGITLHELVERYVPSAGATPNVFLKLDIEGGEYAVWRGDEPLLAKMTGLVVEFHQLDQHWAEMLTLAERLRQAGFVVAHVHGNNYEPLIPGTTRPSALEVTWISAKLLTTSVEPWVRSYPVAGLDQPCNMRAPDCPLTFD